MAEVNNWEIKIEHDGLWPNKWSWEVVYSNFDGGYSHHIFHMRRGETFTRARASRKVTQARLSIERDDLTIYD
jgi:hypothetical protein